MSRIISALVVSRRKSISSICMSISVSSSGRTGTDTTDTTAILMTTPPPATTTISTTTMTMDTATSPPVSCNHILKIHHILIITVAIAVAVITLVIILLLAVGGPVGIITTLTY
jgi:hypothetical protein